MASTQPVLEFDHLVKAFMAQSGQSWSESFDQLWDALEYIDGDSRKGREFYVVELTDLLDDTSDVDDVVVQGFLIEYMKINGLNTLHLANY